MNVNTLLVVETMTIRIPNQNELAGFFKLLNGLTKVLK